MNAYFLVFVTVCVFVTCSHGLLFDSFKEDCYVVSQNGEIIYSGTTSRTQTGITCQRWDQTRPHYPTYPLGPEHRNYCRNPDKDPQGPWCYTMDRRTKWEYCDIPKCKPIRKPDSSKPETPTQGILMTTITTMPITEQTTQDEATTSTVTQMTTQTAENVTESMSNTTLKEMNEMRDQINKEVLTPDNSTEGLVIGGVSVFLIMFAVALLVNKRRITRTCESGSTLKDNQNIQIYEMHDFKDDPSGVAHRKDSEDKCRSNYFKKSSNRVSVYSDEYSHTSHVTGREQNSENEYGALHQDVTADLYDVGNCKGVRKLSLNENYERFVNQTDSDYENTERYSKWMNGFGNTSTPSRNSGYSIYQNT